MLLLGTCCCAGDAGFSIFFMDGLGGELGVLYTVIQRIMQPTIAVMYTYLMLEELSLRTVVDGDAKETICLLMMVVGID